MAPHPTNRPPSANPLRIGRIGADHLQVFIRSGPTELSELVDRLEQLLDVGYDAIDVVFEEGKAEPGEPLNVTRTAATDRNTVTLTDAAAPVPARP